ncbi:hypothetical protein CK203_111985 [Vitis vinifera]|uniref:Uncharacterized protein n=1 Tax=Vitis vinifera TaxID=29760 RepID=A0A438C4P0_VITVI|nr:hypothetical protein CK203_111985 [Vitis vinifera]
MKSQPSAFNAKAGMYTLNEDDDMKAKFAAMTRRLEELELKKMHEVQAVAETPVQPNNNAPYGNTYNSSWRNHPNFSWKARAPQYQQPAQPSQQSSSLEQAIVNLSKVVGDFVGDQKAINAQLSQRIDRMDGMQNDLSQKIDNLQYSISRLTNLNTVQEKGRFPSQPHQNPKGIHEVEIHEGESHSHDWRKGSGKALLDLGASVNLLPYSVYKQLGLGELKPTSITLSLADRSVKFQGEEEGPEEVCIIDTLVEEHCNQNMQDKLERREEILPLFNKEEGEAAEEETPKLNLKPLPMELKYTYLEENNQCPVVISSSLTSHQEKCLLEVLKRCKKAIGWQISDLKGISPLVCTHHIYMEEEAKPIRQPQRRLNPHLQEVVRAEVLKLLQGYYLPISDSPWVSPTQVVPKKSGNCGSE